MSPSRNFSAAGRIPSGGAFGVAALDQFVDGHSRFSGHRVQFICCGHVGRARQIAPFQKIVEIAVLALLDESASRARGGVSAAI
jgi:hypothetical protein